MYDSITLGDKGKCKILGKCVSIGHKGNQVIFDREKCVVKNPNRGDIFITALKQNNVYALNTNEIAAQDFKC